MIIRRLQSGYCPEQSRQSSIIVEYAELRYLGDEKVYYKALGYSCKYCAENKCTVCGSRGEACPIFIQTQNP